MQRSHVVLAALLISAVAFGQQPECDPCVDGPEMFEHRKQRDLEHGTTIEVAAISYECAGPISKTYGGFTWLFSNCSPFQIVIEPGPGNPSVESFALELGSDKVRLSGHAPSDRRLRQAYRELRSLDENQVLAIVEELDAVRGSEDSRPDTSVERVRGE